MNKATLIVDQLLHGVPFDEAIADVEKEMKKEKETEDSEE